MPKAVFSVEGEIEDFTRVDNIYRTLKREAGKLLTKWTIKFDVEYEESEGESEVI